jgi:nitrogen regulatory protein PII
MKRVEVVMKSWALNMFKESASRLGISEYEVSDVRVSPSLAVKERRRLYRAHEYTLDLIAGVKVEFVASDQDAMRVAHEILTLVAPDTIAIFSLDEVMSKSTTSGRTVLYPSAEPSTSELPSLTH